jgi:hypothetical protein
MTIAVVIAVYVVGFVLTYRKASGIVIDDFASSGLDQQTADRILASAIAMVISLMWPLLCVGYGIYRTLTPVTRRERQADLDAREREIVRLERELGIKHDE